MSALKIWSCAEWGAREVSSRFPTGAAQGTCIHHTAGANRKPQAGQAEIDASFKVAREIQAYHMHRNGWADTGQHWTVSRGGVVMEGRHGTLAAAKRGKVVKGAHAGDNTANQHWWGIENEGRYDEALTMPAAQWNALVALCRQLQQWGGFAPESIQPHKHFKNTLCPGLLADRIPELRRLVGAPPTAILMNGVRTTLEATIDAANHAWVPLRAVYEATPQDWQRLRRFTPMGLEVELISLAGERDDRYKVPLDNREGTGWVQANLLGRWGILAAWDGARRELNLTTV